jgi:MFS superfamily sulfate permease-like transporter
MCILIALLFIALFIYFVNQRVDNLSLVENFGDASGTVAVGWKMVVEVWPLAMLFILVGILLVMVYFKIIDALYGKKVAKDDLV